MNSDRVTAAVLAGGGSTRMGQDKALLKLGNKTMIERVVIPLQGIFKNILVVTNEPEKYNMLKNVKFVGDCVKTKEKSSLIGLYSGLKQSETSHIFAIGCDMPFVNTEFIKYMVNLLKDEDIIVPFCSNGLIERTTDLPKNKDMAAPPAREYYQPLYAIYGKGCISEFEELLAKGCYRIASIFKNVNTKKITEEEIKRFDSYMLCFKNINTYEEYLQVMHFFE